jgi:hypothetical protein
VSGGSAPGTGGAARIGIKTTVKKPERRDFLSIDKVVKEVLKDLKGRTAVATSDLDRVWREVLGDTLAGLARVCAVSGSTVEVEATSSAVLSEIRQFYEEEFLERLAEEGIEGIKGVSFRLADG